MAWVILIATLLCPPLGIFGGLIGIYANNKKWKWYVFCMALGIASFAYCYIPNGDPDIVRYWDFVKLLENMPFSRAVTMNMHGDGNLYVYTAFAWLCAQSGDLHLLPACSVFIVYYIGFYITCQIGADLKARKSTIVIYLIFIILALNFYGVVNNVRNISAFAMISMAVFREMYQKKYDVWTLLLYVLPLFIHTSAVLLILLRIIALFSGKIRIILFGLVSNIMLAIDVAYKVINQIGMNNGIVNMIRSMVNKAHFYFHNSTSEWGRIVMKSTSYKLDRYLNVALAVMVCMLLLLCAKDDTKKNSGFMFLFQKQNQISNSRLELLKSYVFLLALATIGCLPMVMPEYWRFYSVTVLTASVPFLILSNSNRQYKRILSYLIFVGVPLDAYIMGRFLLNCDRFSFIIKPMVSNPFVVLIKMLMSKS